MNTKLILKISTLVSVLFMALGVIFVVLVWFYGDEIETSTAIQANVLNPYFILTYVVLSLCAFFAIIFPIGFLTRNPKSAIQALLILIGFVLLFGISYLLASGSIDGDVLQKAFEKGNITSSSSRLVGMGLISTYIIIAVTVIVTIYSGVSQILKK